MPRSEAETYLFKYINLGLTLLTLFVTTPSWSVTPVAGDASPILNTTSFVIPYESYDYNKMFAYTRELLTRKPVTDMLKEIFAEELKVSPALAKKLAIDAGGIKEVSEAQFMLLLEENKDLWPMLDQYIKAVPRGALTEKNKAIHKLWHDKFKTVLDNPKLKANFKKYNDPTRPFELKTESGGPGYRNATFVSDTKRVYLDANRKVVKTVAAQDMREGILDFIKGTTKQIKLNVYDFDLEVLSDELIALAKDGKDVSIGIDIRNAIGKGTGKAAIKAPEATKANYEKLLAASKKYKNLKVYAVDSVGLNHQKLIVRDWEVKDKGAVLMSSGNLTTSCIAPEGDLCGLGTKSPYSIPNANHYVVVDSDVHAQLANHELSKPLDMGLRGKENPLGGTWIVYKDGKGVKAADREYFVAAFSPNGALGDINQQIISEMIRQRKGELLALQFAFSSKEDGDAIYAAILADLNKGIVPFRSVGDTPMAAREWSVFVDMLGIVKDPKTGIYKPDPKNKWNQLSEKVKEKLKAQIRAAPENYGTHQVMGPDGKMIEVTSKIHDKVIMDDEKGIFGTSFNFSDNAETNNEAIFLWKDKAIVADGHAMFEGLFADANKTLYEVLNSKNEYTEKGPPLKGGAKCKTAVDDVLSAIKPGKKRTPAGKK